MTKPNTFPIYHKLYQFTKSLYGAVHNMPKEYKYELGREMIALSQECLDLALEVNSKSDAEKLPSMKQLSLIFDKLKMRLRLAQELKIITIGQYAHWQSQWLVQIGQMIGGWLKWAV